VNEANKTVFVESLKFGLDIRPTWLALRGLRRFCGHPMFREKQVGGPAV
jgi:hypothetical protein